MTIPLADEILLRLLEAEGRPLSGQALAGRLGVTRAAVWKGVRSLRGRGYPVQGEPARGYRLAGRAQGLGPGELASVLKTRVMGRAVRHFERLDSTNREVERWAADGGPEGALVVAEHQTQGRGRLGRNWHDEPGRSLLFSLLLRPAVPPAEAPLLTFVAALSLSDTLERYVPAGTVEVKWPNDVLLAGRKAAGILLECRTEAQAVSYVALGVGINVGGRREDLPAGFRADATTLEAESTQSAARLDVLRGFLEAFEEAYGAFLAGGFESLRPRWNTRFRMAGRPVAVTTPTGRVEGLARGLGPGGALLIEGGDEVRAIYAGDVEIATTRP